jgi:hypothetical protein
MQSAPHGRPHEAEQSARVQSPTLAHAGGFLSSRAPYCVRLYCVLVCTCTGVSDALGVAAVAAATCGWTMTRSERW